MRSLVEGGHRYILDGDGTEKLFSLSDVWERNPLSLSDSLVLPFQKELARWPWRRHCWSPVAVPKSVRRGGADRSHASAVASDLGCVVRARRRAAGRGLEDITAPGIAPVRWPAVRYRLDGSDSRFSLVVATDPPADTGPSADSRGNCHSALWSESWVASPLLPSSCWSRPCTRRSRWCLPWAWAFSEWLCRDGAGGSAFLRRTLPLFSILFASAASLVLSIESLMNVPHRPAGPPHLETNPMFFCWSGTRYETTR